MFACSLILSRIDYDNAVPCRAQMTTINKLQHAENNAAQYDTRCYFNVRTDCAADAKTNSCEASTRETALAARRTAHQLQDRFGARRRRHISTATSRHVNALETFGHQRLQRCTSRSPGPTTPSAPSAARLQLSGTRYPVQCSIMSLCQLLNLATLSV